ncbi:MAG TPA: hypothetical protein PLS56_01460 [Candidatus Dojkabacteria bacterium]|nr:hypothetical protein [Candidatus Dojkabacteria bacterium]
MAGLSIKISPIEKTYPANFKTFESSLAAAGYHRAPGTNSTFIPQKEADGRYRTGLDKNAVYIKRMEEVEQKAEIALIDKLLKRLSETFGDKIDFSNPRSDVWNAFSDSDVKVSVIKLGNSSTILNPDIVPQDLLDYCWLRVDKRIAKSSESFQRGECRGCQFYIENAEAENRVLYQRKKEINKAIVAFENLTSSKQKQVARLLGLPITDDTGEEAIYNMMDTLLKKPEFEGSEFKGLSPIKVFTDIVKMSDDTLYIKDLIEQAIRYNIYRKGTGDKVLEGAMTIAASKDDLVVHLLDPANQKELLALEAKIKSKRIALL